jgi:hypothetical protein
MTTNLLCCLRDKSAARQDQDSSSNTDWSTPTMPGSNSDDTLTTAVKITGQMGVARPLTNPSSSDQSLSKITPLPEEKNSDAPSITVKTTDLMEKILNQKNTNKDKALEKRWKLNPKEGDGFLEGMLIAGDGLTMGAMTLQGVQILKPSINTISSVTSASLAFGLLAGIIDIAVAILCLKQAIIHLKNGNKTAARRDFFHFIIYSAIGVIMTLTALAGKVAAFSTLTAFFAANPWLLPVLFFIAGLPVFYEVAMRIYRSRAELDFGSKVLNSKLDDLIGTLQLNLSDDDINKTITEDKETQKSLENYIKENQEENIDAIRKAWFLSRKFEVLSADMGIEAAIETFKLLRLHMNQEDEKDQLKIAQGKIKEWNNAQYLRLTQRILSAAAFGFSMWLIPHPNALISAIESFAMAGANAIPLYMDLFWPFKRNTPIAVEMADPILIAKETAEQQAAKNSAA